MPRPIQPGTLAAAIVTEEEKLLAHVEARLAAAGAEGGPLPDYDRELVELRDLVAEAKPEDVAPLVEQMARVQAIAARRGRSRALPVDPMSPYFAHLRLRDDKGRRDVLLGKRGFIDREGGVQIVDWRHAPVSQVYYRYDEGDDYEETFDGRPLRGVVEARRNLSIHQALLRRIGCPQGTFVRDARGVWHEAEGQAVPTLQGGQGTAARPPRPEPPRKGKKGPRPGPRLGVHGGPVPRADKHLPEIAALIDREQFELITQPTSGLVVIQGGAGSGKTTVALHRVAYLNFADPKRFSPRKMLVVVPSPSLERYVEGVLPALGVPGVPVVTWRGWATTMRRRLVPQAGARYADDTPEAVAHVKKHPALLRLLEGVVARQADDTGRALAEAAAGDAAARGLVRRWDELRGEPLVARCRRALSWLERHGDAIGGGVRHRLESLLRQARHRAADVVRTWLETLTDEALLRAAFAGAPDVTADELARTLRWTARQGETPAEEEHGGIDEERLEAVDGAPLEDSGVGRLDAEDDALLIRLHQLVNGGLVDARGHETRFEHVAIDEAQDLAPVEVKVLLEATTPQRCVTIAGDTAQRLVFDNSFRDFPTLLGDAGHERIEIRPLRLSYRSTAEVMRFARAVLGPLADPDQPLVARQGAEVACFRFEEMGEAVAMLADALRSVAGREPSASVAILARHPEQADAWYGALARAEVPGLRRVRRHDFAFAPGVDVTDVTQIKGLEFDYVILVEVTAANYPDTVEARHLLNIAATRAAHQLWLVATAEPSPLVPAESIESGWA